MKLYCIFLAFLSVLLLACSKNDNDTPEPQTRLKFINYSTGTNIAYTYANGRMVSETYTYSGGSTLSTFTEFDAQNRLTKYTNGDDRVEISYIDGTNHWEKKYFALSTGVLHSKTTIQKNGNTIVATYYSATTPAGVYTQKDIYSFDTDMHNILKIESYNSDGTKTQTRVYSNFDNKKTISEFYPIGFFVVGAGRNNYGTDTHTLHETGTISTETCTHQYNNHGYVTKTSFATGFVINYQYETY